MNSCSACGSSQETGIAFCTSCGHPFDPSMVPETQLPELTPVHEAERVQLPEQQEWPQQPDSLGAGHPSQTPVATPTPGYGAPEPGYAEWERWAPPPAYAWPRTCGWATAGVIFAFLCAPLGLVFSLIALFEINRSGGMLVGRGWAVVGIVLSAFMLLLMTSVGA